jgi:hypothetical protein
MDTAEKRIEGINAKFKQKLEKLSRSYEKEWDELMDAQFRECENIGEMYARREILRFGYRRRMRRIEKKHNAEIRNINQKYTDAHERICSQHAKEVNEARREESQKLIEQLGGPL